MTFFIDKISTGFELNVGPKGIKSLRFGHFKQNSRRKSSLDRLVEEWLKNYVEGFMSPSSPFPFEHLDLSEATPFERKVWMQLHRIPFGKTESYQSIAKKIGNAKAPRAVGQANKRNPIPLLIPCHRVIASDGTLGGYSCGLGLKKKLLKHEGINIKNDLKRMSRTRHLFEPTLNRPNFAPGSLGPEQN